MVNFMFYVFYHNFFLENSTVMALYGFNKSSTEGQKPPKNKTKTSYEVPSPGLIYFLQILVWGWKWVVIFLFFAFLVCAI